MSLKSMLFGSSKDIKALENERNTYKKKSEKLEEELELLKESALTKAGSNRTSFVSEKIEKIQELENELIVQKQRVQEAKKIAQDANHVKKDFLVNMRHEVRTPMNSILAFSDMLMHELKNKTQISYAKNIFTSGHKLLALMDNIIELSRLESGLFEVENRAVDISLFFNEVIREYKVKASKKGLNLTLEIDDELPTSLMIDDQKVKNILDNLMNNAIKFTSHGDINVKVVVKQYNHTENTIDLAISIADTGMGVDPKNHQKIFEIFEKRENCNEIEFQGTGLGLSINKKMAELMNGDITILSAVGEGSTFTLTIKGLEVILVSAEDNIDESDIDFSVVKPDGATLMVIDNVENSYEVIENAFEATNTEVLTFDNPRAALEALKEKKIDLIFIDIDMLSTDHNAVSKVLAKMSKAPVVSLTSTTVKDIELIKDGANIVGHLKKPISKVELFKISLKVLNSSATYSSSSKTISPSSNEFSHLDKASVEKFLAAHLKELEPLYEQSIATNDLNTIGSFATILLYLAKKYNITLFVDFSEELLAKIELFDIESINSMMIEYKAKIKRLQNL